MTRKNFQTLKASDSGLPESPPWSLEEVLDEDFLANGRGNARYLK
jgi:hypothetical protein